MKNDYDLLERLNVFTPYVQTGHNYVPAPLESSTIFVLVVPGS